MKKIVALLLTVLTLMTLVSCGGPLEWPNGKLGSLIPHIEGAKGEVSIDSLDSLHITLENISEEQYFEYVESCKSKGFSLDITENSGSFVAFNKDGYKIDIYYFSSGDMRIAVDAPITMSTFDWPDSDIAKLLPKPNSDYGKIEWEADYGFVIYIGNTTKADYKEYVKAVSENGFTVNYKKGDDFYYADNVDGYSVQIKYEGFNIMFVRIDEPKEDDATEATTPNEEVSSTEASTPKEESSTETTPPDDPPFTFTEMIVVDNEECMIKIKSLGTNSIFGYSIKIELENRSTDKTYMFSLTGAAINGVEYDPFFASEVAAGKKANETIYISDSFSKETGIKEYTDIELHFRVYDSNDWLAENAAEETVHVYPLGEDKATLFVRENQDTDTVVIDNEFVTMIVIGYGETLLGYEVKLYLINKTDVELMFSANEVSVNGYMLDPFFASSCMAGKQKFCSMTWYNFEENGIEKVEEIEFMLRVYNSDDWLADDCVNQKITLNP